MTDSYLLRVQGDRMTNLKPCPFCGGKAKVYQDEANDWRVKCEDCFADCGSVSRKRELVIKVWNTRYEHELREARVAKCDYLCLMIGASSNVHRDLCGYECTCRRVFRDLAVDRNSLFESETERAIALLRHWSKRIREGEL